MNLRESILMAGVDIRVNKMRTFLSMLGIIIGIASVIIIVGLGNGLKFKILDQFSGMGADQLFVTPNWDSRTNRMGEINMKDLAYIKSLPGVVDVSPQIGWTTDVKSTKKSQQMEVRGVTEEFFPIAGMKLDQGRLITSTDLDLRQSICILKPAVVATLFGHATTDRPEDILPNKEEVANVLGKTVNAGDHRLTVVGVLTNEQSNMGFFWTAPNTIFVPVTLLLRLSQSKSVNGMSIQIDDINNAKKIGEDILNALKERHEYKGAYNVISPDDIQKQISTALNIFTMVIGAIGGLSLFVGGIGIMNIMLASVAERTREVGIRKAIGAKRRDILIQFLVEAGSISGFGGIIGILLGIALTKSIAILSQDNVPAVILPSSILIAFLFSILVGMFFGIYPSSKAANLNPIEALRYE